MHERTVKSKRIFSGRLLTLEVLDVELEDGRRSVREIIRHPGAVAALVRRADGKFALIRQFRKPIEQEYVEIVAGGLKKGERPAACARREIGEETGYGVRRLRSLGPILSSPGFSDEVIHLFYADLSTRLANRSLDDDEHVEVVALTRSQIERMIASGRITDAKTLAAWLRAGQAGLL